jgi:hypothetical protein
MRKNVYVFLPGVATVFDTARMGLRPGNSHQVPTHGRRRTITVAA